MAELATDGEFHAMTTEEAWRWVERYIPLLVTIVGGHGVSRPDFDDRLHDAAVEMHRRLLLHRSDGVSIEKWAHACANYAALEVRRLARWEGFGYRSHPVAGLRVGDTDVEEGMALPLPAVQPTGEQRVALREALDKLERIDRRTADVMALWATGRMLTEIGSVYGLTGARVSQIVRKGRRAIMVAP